MLRTGRLSEKPWRVDAVGRLLASVFICFFIGATVATILQYFESPPKSSAPLFIFYCAGAFGSYIAAIVFLLTPWKQEKFLTKLISLLSCIYAGFMLNWLAQRQFESKSDLQNPVVTMLIAVVCFQGIAVVLTYFFLREHRMNWSEGFGLRDHPGKCIALGIFVGLFALVPTWGLQALSSKLLETLTLHPQQQEAVTILSRVDSYPERFVLGIATIFIAPIGEEIIFRGILYPTIKRFGHPQLALWITSILFGAIHANLATLIPLTGLAVLLVYLYEYTGNLLTCIAVHCVFNAANFVALYLVRDTLSV